MSGASTQIVTFFITAAHNAFYKLKLLPTIVTKMLFIQGKSRLEAKTGRISSRTTLNNLLYFSSGCSAGFPLSIRWVASCLRYLHVRGRLWGSLMGDTCGLIRRWHALRGETMRTRQSFYKLPIVLCALFAGKRIYLMDFLGEVIGFGNCFHRSSGSRKFLLILYNNHICGIFNYWYPHRSSLCYTWVESAEIHLIFSS